MSIRSLFQWVISQISGRQKQPDNSRNEEINALLIDTFAEYTSGDLTAGSWDVNTIDQACRRMQHAKTKGELVHLLADEMARFDLRYLEQMYARFDEKTRDLPESYRNLLLPKVKEQLFAAHHRLLLLARSGEAEELIEPLSPAVWAFFEMVGIAAREKAKTKDPTFLYLKYLLAGFTIFVMGEPAHPVGTPFPGGQIVDEWDGEYLCPVRDYADEIRFALCPFCPAVQSVEPTYPEMREERRRRRRKESRNNYWMNYKG
ncbi:MAG: DUF2115 domain-containing protein [Methanocalculus sp.]|uniref:DUF2115 domain-containing protein n=1 Tax=Methanocalculus sp. TaxID=2004547 RepID=UPI00271B2C87|nr:DUF2115 domain-containing protein [Methanocalculus sp.]MDO9538418.1 DUF2115 domain-containing protein [Methanocalculus sp.]